MRILMLHNRYEIRGGEDESTDLEAALLRSKGHEVCLLEASNSEIGGSIGHLGTAKRSFWNDEWYVKVLNKLSAEKFDILHVQNFFPLISPSVYYAAKRTGTPVVQAIRNYRLVCPSANLFRDNVYCEKCVNKYFKYPAIYHGCYRHSKAGSAVIAAMSAFHSARGTWHHRVDKYIAISDYVKQQLIAGGFRASSIAVKPNFVSQPSAATISNSQRTHFLFVGRLSAEKGIPYLLDAYERAGVKTPLKVVGEGDCPQPQMPGVEWLGRRTRDQVAELMAQAKAVIVPGQWPEPFGRVAVESLAVGTPVICTNFGGVADIVDDNKTGLLVPPARADLLAQSIQKLDLDGILVERMSLAAVESFQQRYTSDKNYEILMNIYNGIIQNK